MIEKIKVLWPHFRNLILVTSKYLYKHWPVSIPAGVVIAAVIFLSPSLLYLLIPYILILPSLNKRKRRLLAEGENKKRKEESLELFKQKHIKEIIEIYPCLSFLEIDYTPHSRDVLESFDNDAIRALYMSWVQTNSTSNSYRIEANHLLPIIKDIEGFFSNGTNFIELLREGRELGAVFFFRRALHDMNDKERSALKICFSLLASRKINGMTLISLISPIVLNQGECSIENNTTVRSKAVAQASVNTAIPSRVAVSNIFDLVNKYTPKDLNSLVSGNSWFSQKDFDISEQFSPYYRPDGLLLGGVGGELVFYIGEKGVIDIAPSGSGKTQCHMLINLRKSPCSAIVLDIKGECYDETAEGREQEHGAVFKFSPEDPDNSHCYNPMSFISKDEKEVWEQSRFLAEMLSPLSNAANPSWELDGQSFLTLAIAYVVLTKDNPVIADVLDVVSGAEIEDMFDDILDNKDKYPRAMFRTATSHNNTYEKSEKQWQGVQKAANQHLRVWEGSKMEQVTRKTDWTPKDFRDVGTTLYLCVPPNAIETYAPALRVIIGQHVRSLMADGQMAAFKKSGLPIIFYLDELPRLGNMEPIREALEVGRSYGIKLWMIAQYTGQLEKAYPGLAEGMIENCGVQIYMNVGDSDAQKISKRLGKQESVLDGKEHPMVEPHDLTGPEYKEKMVVFVSGEKPALLDKIYDHRIEWNTVPPTEEDTTTEASA